MTAAPVRSRKKSAQRSAVSRKRSSWERSVGGPEPIQGPGLSARPGRVGAPALMGAVPQELARLEVEDRLVSRAAVASHEVTSGRQAVLGGDPQEVLVAGRPSGFEDDPDVHHDVDEAGVGADERAQVAALLVEPQCHRAPGVDDRVLLGRIARGLEPSLPGRDEQEAEVMDGAIVLARLDQEAVALGLLAPPGVTRPAGDDPDQAAEEPLGPVGPRLVLDVPAAADRVDRERAGLCRHESLDLAAGEAERFLGSGFEAARERRGLDERPWVRSLRIRVAVARGTPPDPRERRR